MSRRQLDLVSGEAQTQSRKRASDASQVREDVRELVRMTDTLLGYPQGHGNGSTATYDELYNVFRLSGDIAFNLGKMAASARRTDKHGSKPSKSKEIVPCPIDSDEELPLSQLICHNCDAVNTPRWRNGPDGPCTLCNACGLVYAKRKRRGDYR